MTRMHPVVPALAVQGAVLALAIGRATVPLAVGAGVAVLVLLLTVHSRESLPGAGILAGAALTTAAVLLVAGLPVGPGWLGGIAPIALAAGYLLATSPISLPHRRIRGSAREPRRSS